MAKIQLYFTDNTASEFSPIYGGIKLDRGLWRRLVCKLTCVQLGLQHHITLKDLHRAMITVIKTAGMLSLQAFAATVSQMYCLSKLDCKLLYVIGWGQNLESALFIITSTDCGPFKFPLVFNCREW
jgi:hypothetical protein